MDALITFFEGIITFVSPCLLPMLPIYLAYFAGGSAPEGSSTHYSVVRAVGFVIGFTLVFTLLGAFAATLGGLLVRYQRILDLVLGLLVVMFGLNYLGVLHINVLERTLRLQLNILPHSFARAFLFGMIFAIGWTPCVGTFLASALSLAARSAQAGHGVWLLLCYSAGLGLPFVLAALAVDQLKVSLAFLRAHRDLIDRICGAFLVFVGIAMATGTLGALLRVLSVGVQT